MKTTIIWGDTELKTDENGDKYLQFDERDKINYGQKYNSPDRT